MTCTFILARIIVLSVASFAAGCASSGAGGAPPFIQNLAAAPRYSLTPTETAAVQARIKAALKDPDSAKFSRPVAGRQVDGSVLVCGGVNAKNGFGGYTGMKTYYATLRDGSVSNLTVSEEVERYGIALHPCPAS